MEQPRREKTSTRLLSCCCCFVRDPWWDCVKFFFSTYFEFQSLVSSPLGATRKKWGTWSGLGRFVSYVRRFSFEDWAWRFFSRPWLQKLLSEAFNEQREFQRIKVINWFGTWLTLCVVNRGAELYGQTVSARNELKQSALPLLLTATVSPTSMLLN